MKNGNIVIKATKQENILVNLAKRVNIKKLVSILLVFGSLFWLVWIIQADIRNDWKQILPKDYLWAIIALVIGVISQFINVIIFSQFLRIDKENFHFFQVSKLFFTGQIIRYMPGRVWGIFYQVMNASTNTPKKNILQANIELMFVAFTGLLTISFSIIIFSLDSWYISILFFIFGFLFIIIVLLKGWLTIILELADNLLRRNEERIFFLPLSLNVCLSTVSLFCLSWVIYLFGWLSLGEAGYGGDTTPTTMLMLASTYSISWFIGYMSMITPSGLGVREASFLLLAQGIATSSELVLLAIVVRLWLLLIDLILFLTFSPIKPNKNIIENYSQ